MLKVDAAGVPAGGGIPVDPPEYGKVIDFSDVVLGGMWCGDVVALNGSAGSSDSARKFENLKRLLRVH